VLFESLKTRKAKTQKRKSSKLKNAKTQQRKSSKLKNHPLRLMARDSGRDDFHSQRCKTN